jgi:NAD(P)-dependent dehydrogenase (short-subunit alcohol dehydrogenase family)
MNRLSNKVAIITGGSLGIGKAIAQQFAKEGAHVIITDVLEEEGRATTQEINDAGGKADFFRLDVSDASVVEECFKAVHNKCGSIDILVNNAGISGVDKPTHEVTEEEWDKVINVNVKGVFLCTKYVIPYLQEAGAGSIINLSSIYGLVSAPDLPAYHASKGAVTLMTKTDALFYAKERIRVNSIHPGFIWTPLVEELANRSPEGPEKFRENLDRDHPIGHIGAPEDIAWGAVYLASDESQFVTGSELVIDGGYTAQ